MKTFYFVIFLFLASGCYRTENGLVFGKPDYEKRDAPVTVIDLEILEKAEKFLANEKVWSRSGSMECNESESLSLICALSKASISINGEYVHRQQGLQEVRFVIDDLYRQRWSVHRLSDFNSHPETTHNEVLNVLSVAKKRVKSKLAQ